MRTRHGKRATVADVAALAGVSPGTVSKALNGRGQLSADTRRRVRAAAEQLGFEPNAIARGLVEGRTYTVGMLTTDSFGRFTLPVMLGAEDALGAGQMSVLLCDGRGDPIREQHYLRTLLARRVDGIVVTGRRREPRQSIGRDLPIPVVYALAPSEDPADTSVVPDDEQAGRIAVEHLLASGRRRIGHITGPQHHLSARLREKGAVGVLAESGLLFDGGVVHWGEWSEAWGRHATNVLLRTDHPPEAVLCGSDQIARGVADAVREAGRRVPHDVAIVGFDNWDVMAQASRPPLTTVDLQLPQLGRYAAQSLLAAIEGDPRPGLRSLPGVLVIRESTSVTPVPTLARASGSGAHQLNPAAVAGS